MRLITVFFILSTYASFGQNEHTLNFVFANNDIRLSEKNKSYLNLNLDEMLSDNFILFISNLNGQYYAESKSEAIEFINELNKSENGVNTFFSDDKKIIWPLLSKYFKKGISEVNLFLFLSPKYIDDKMLRDEAGLLLDSFTKELSVAFHTPNINIKIFIGLDDAAENSKYQQSVSNSYNFGSKDPYMKTFNLEFKL